MAAVDLLFDSAPSSTPLALVFGADVVPPDSVASLAIQLPPLGFHATAGARVKATFAVALPALSFGASAAYNSDTERPIVGNTRADWQVAQTDVEAQVTSRRGAGGAAQGGVTPPWRAAVPIVAGTLVSEPERTVRARTSATGAYRNAERVASSLTTARFQQGLRDRRAAARGRYDTGVPVGTASAALWREMLHDRRNSAEGRFASAKPLSARRSDAAGAALPLTLLRRERYQEAIVPPPGITVIVVPPPVDGRCYIPPLGNAVALLFTDAPGSTDLLFVCEQHAPPPPPPATVVVPVLPVYMISNSASLRRVDTDTQLVVLAMSLSLDSDSWTWGVSAKLDISAEQFVQPGSDGNPIELEATVNGLAYRFLAEQIKRDRTFGSAAISVQGRGRLAVLDAPYAPVLDFGNTEDRTAQQLLADILTTNGVSMGYAIDWQLTDWLVPAGAFSCQGSYMAALLQVAGAAGGYLQPHPTDDAFSVLARYPVAPWNWGSVTPDFELPSSITTQEGVEWRSLPTYNRVYVSGTKTGVLGEVTLTGSAGDLLAPMVTDALITHADAARQRGIAVLGNTGRQAIVTLRTPVLPDTGIIVPGKFVRYTDGAASMMGIVRGTSVDVGYPEVWQQLTVETHV